MGSSTFSSTVHADVCSDVAVYVHAVRNVLIKTNYISKNDESSPDGQLCGR